MKTILFDTYMQKAKKTEMVGVIIVFISIFINELSQRKLYVFAISVACIGAFIASIGGSSKRPSMCVISFAKLLQDDPNEENAKALIETLERLKDIKLSDRQIKSLQFAEQTFSTKNPSSSLIKQLDEALMTHIHKAKKKRFLAK